VTDKKEKQIRLGVKAKAFLADETIQAAFGSVEQVFVERWKVSTDAAERERCWMATNVVQQVKLALATFVNNGKIAQSDLDRIMAEKAA
jgi:hypothetical protein